jgi:hypothetical protein
VLDSGRWLLVSGSLFLIDSILHISPLGLIENWEKIHPLNDSYAHDM